MGNNLIISYDLSQPNRNYSSLVEVIKTLGSWAHVHGSVWYVNSSLTVSQARDRLVRVLDQDDSVIVFDASNNDAAWHNLKPEVAALISSCWSARYAA